MIPYRSERARRAETADLEGQFALQEKRRFLLKVSQILLGAGVLGFVAYPAAAQERIVDGAGGALAGVLVAGPVGAVAGGIIGFAAGPNIARGMGLKHHRHYHHIRHVKHAPD
jgi:hypothetical protein